MSTLCNIISKHGGLIQTGPFGSQLHEYEYVDVGVPVVMPKDIVGGKINYGTIARVSEEKASQLHRHKLQAGDIVFPRRGDIGKCAFVSKNDAGCLCGTGCLKITVPDAVLSPRFLFYFLGLPESVKWLENNSTGSTMMNLNTDILGRIEIPDLPIERQRRIADVLSAYDDLIENNRRRIAILEETARLTYRKWLSEDYALIKTTKIGEFVDLQNGFAFKSNTFVAAGQYKIITIKNVKDVIVDSGNVAFVESIPARMPAHCRILPKDILLSLTGNVGRVSIAIEQNGLLNQRVAKVKSDFPWFSLLVLKSNECFRLMNNLAVGAAQQNLSPVKLCDEFIEVPTRTGMAHVERLVAPLFDHIVLLAQQSVALAAARDMLLPRLMKGEVNL